MTIKIPVVGKGSKMYYTLVDVDDLHLVLPFKWRILKRNNNLYAYFRTPGGEILPMHRWISNAPQGKVVHHINENTLDNRKGNLAILTNGEHLHVHAIKRWGKGRYGKTIRDNQRNNEGVQCAITREDISRLAAGM